MNPFDGDRPVIVLAVLLVTLVSIALRYHATASARDLKRIGALRLPNGFDQRGTARSSNAWLILPAVTCAAVSVAISQRPARASATTPQVPEIMVVIDVSRSMLAADVPPTRLDRAIGEIVLALAGAGESAIGIVATAGDAVLVCPATVDHEAVKATLHSLLDSPATSGSSLALGLSRAGDAFSAGDHAKAIVLVSDGDDTEGGVAEALSALERRVLVHAIAVGTRGGAPVPRRAQSSQNESPLVSTVNEELLGQIAAKTGGANMTLQASGALSKLFAELNDRQEVSHTAPHLDPRLSQLLVAVAFVLLTIDLLFQASKIPYRLGL